MRLEQELDVELSRLEVEYTRRASVQWYAERYSYFNEAALLHVHGLERHVLAALKRHHLTSLVDKKILDVGCGRGGQLQRFLEYGATPSNLAGIDLMAPRIEVARRAQPAIDWRVGSAHHLPYPDATFDLVMSFVVFSSILDESLQQRIIDEMWRVRKPGGLILLYDFAYANPRNAAVRGVNQRKARALFQRPGVRFDFRQITLAPPLSRLIAPRAYWLAQMLEQCQLLNTHLLGIIDLDEQMEQPTSV